eukprot:NODE_36_length_36011_cov_1.012920.p9 type:complete len:422 gc:universal NODE_36_length_36011_cov_1.012920:13661-12396(-)
MLSNSDFGILHIQLYTPPYAIKQSVLEQHDNCPGKYTKGLGQLERSVNHFTEDSVSMAMTVVKNALLATNIPASQIGRIDVGTETRTDSSKSIVSHLQQLLNVTDIEGIDCTNACFGGTAALFNAFNWCYSPFYNNKFALVITSDIAIYNGTPNATGGAGAVCLIIGPNAHLKLNHKYSNFIQHQYDFFKPNPLDGLPVVNGQLSIKCYFNALLSCYEDFKAKQEIQRVDNYDSICMHAPFAKQVEKGILLLKVSDALINNSKTGLEIQLFDILNSHNICHALDLLNNKLAMKECLNICNEFISNKSKDGLALPKLVGNSYCSSLYTSLFSLLSSNTNHKNILMFSYGSGCMARMFELNQTGMVGLDGINCVENRDLLDFETFHEWTEKYIKLRVSDSFQSNQSFEHLSVYEIHNWERSYK